MTGANTVIADDPRLTVRLSDRGGITRKQPLRVVVDGLGRTPPQSRIFKEPGQTLLVLGNTLSPEAKLQLTSAGAEIIEFPSEGGAVDLKQLLKALGERQITNVLVEGGGILVGSLFDAGLVDKVVAFYAPIVIGGEEARPAVAGRGIEKLSDCVKLKQVKVERIGEDIMVCGYVSR